MKYVTIHPPGKLTNQPWQLPPSKSWTVRFCLIPLLTGRSVEIYNPLQSPDLGYLLKSLEQLGCSIQKNPLKIHPPKQYQSCHLYLGNSGLALRLLLAILSCDDGCYVLDGDASLRTQPLHSLVLVLRQMGVKITYLEKEGLRLCASRGL